jgi:hypothetical protein
MNFTERMGIPIPHAEIKIRYEAPSSLRIYLFQLMLVHEHHLKKIREYVCFITKSSKDPSNWGENEFMREEISTIMDSCPWNRIYDIIEYFYLQLSISQKISFEKDINEYFEEKGIGWKLHNGKIEFRGDETFENEIRNVEQILEDKGLKTSKNEIKEAIADLSKRPKADITGSIQHSLAALECLCREVTGDKKDTLGTLMKDYPEIVPNPLGEAIKKIWGFSSEQGRHLKEGGAPEYEEAELLVHLSASLCVYLGKKHFNCSCNL